MKQDDIHIKGSDPLKELMGRLEGKVFHVSLTLNWDKIRESGEISPNKDNTKQTTFGSAINSYFRNRDCVSVFDYRNIHDDEPQKFINNCKPTDPLIDGKSIVIFILKQSEYARLITSDNLNIKDFSQMVVPHIEAGYPGAIKLDNIEEVIFVTMTQNLTPLAGALLNL